MPRQTETPASLRKAARLVTGQYKKDLLTRATLLERQDQARIKLAEHNARIAKSEQARRSGRVMAVKIEAPKPFDPEAGRYRMARALPGSSHRRRPGWEGMPPEAPTHCPSCGRATPGYGGFGNYICAVDRLSTKNVGCGRQFSGPMNRSEVRWMRNEAPRLPPDPQWTVSQLTGTGYPRDPLDSGGDDLDAVFS